MSTAINDLHCPVDPNQPTLASNHHNARTAPLDPLRLNIRVMHDEPVFPLDLERDIFEFTALKYPSTIPHLLRVCRRVLAWVEPILYKVLRLDKIIPMWVIQSGVVDLRPPTPPQTPSPSTGVARLFGTIFRHGPRPDSPTFPESDDLIYRDRSAFLRANVKHISLTMPLLHRSTTADWQRVCGILLLNPVVFELVIRQYTSTESGLRQPIPAAMRPTRLTLQFGRDGAGIVSIDLTEPLFSCVTHLTLLNTPESRHHLPIQTHWAAEIPTLPALTHLCVSPNIAQGLVPAVLETCRKLKAFVAAWLTDPPIPPGRERLAALRVRAEVEGFGARARTIRDARVVIAMEPNFLEAWERDARGGYDMWARVDGFIARKRRGEIDPSVYLLDERSPAEIE